MPEAPYRGFRRSRGRPPGRGTAITSRLPASQPRYAGIGSRDTPAGELMRLERVAAAYARAGWVLRTGASPGADQAFCGAAVAAAGHVELYLPWPGFERESWAAAVAGGLAEVLERPSRDACALAATLHPGWRELSGQERLLLARDCHQVLGADLASPARCVICWAHGASREGAGMWDDGTGQALRLAAARGVPAFNLASAGR